MRGSLVVSAAVLLVGCGGPVQKVIGPEGGTLEGPAGLKLFIDPGTVTRPTEFAVDSLDALTAGLTGQSLAFAIHSGAATLEKPVHVGMPPANGACVALPLRQDSDQWVVAPGDIRKGGGAMFDLAAAAPIGSATPDPASLHGRIFWSDSGNVMTSDADGHNPTVFVPGNIEEHVPMGIATNPRNCRIYWTDNGTDSLYSAAMDGTDQKTLYTNPDRYSNPADVAVDSDWGKVFLANADEILEMSTEGANQHVFWKSTTPAFVGSVAVDPKTHEVYWTDNFSDTVRRANPDGTGVRVIYLSGDPYSNPTGVAIDSTNGILYWSENEALKASDLDGANVRTVYSAGYGYDIVPVPEAGVLLINDSETDTVQRLPVSGGSPTQLYVNPDRYSNPRGIAAYFGP